MVGKIIIHKQHQILTQTQNEFILTKNITTNNQEGPKSELWVEFADCLSMNYLGYVLHNKLLLIDLSKKLHFQHFGTFVRM